MLGPFTTASRLAHSPDVASGTVARRVHIDVHDNADDNAWQGTAMAPWNGPNKQEPQRISRSPRSWCVN